MSTVDVKQHILLIEDNQDDETLISRNLRNLPNPVVVIRDGQEALDYLFATGDYQGRDLDNRPCLILLDLNLPRVDGMEILQKIRAHEKTHLIPVVILTASEEQNDMLSSYEHGANSYVKKPLSAEEFKKVIGLIGLYWTFFTVRPPLT